MKNLVFLLLAVLLLLLSCDFPSRETDQRSIYIVYTDWAESIALTGLSQVLLEEYLGYEVITRLTGIDTVFADIAAGRADLFPDVWMPHTHAGFLETYAGQYEDLGPNYLKARTGLVVPQYMAVESIPGLADYYTGPIAGIDTSAGIMQNTLIALAVYELDNELLVMSDPQMAEMLGNAVRRRNPIVVTGWEPHWIFHRYDLKYLDDPLGVYLEQEQIHTIGRIGLSDQHPRVAELFGRMVLNERHINGLMDEIERERLLLEGVREWIRKNEFVVNRWVRGLAPEREKIM